MNRIEKDQKSEAVKLIKLLKQMDKEQQMGVLLMVEGAKAIKKED